MPVSVGYDDERLEFAIPEDRIVASWNGPAGLDGPHELAAIREAIEQPCDFPPLRQMIVPGDRVAIALDPSIARPQPILEEIGRVLREAGVEPEDLTVLAPSAVRAHLLAEGSLAGATLAVHDSRNRGQLAYLAATGQGRRIYLNRILTDADVVIPVGRLGYDPIMGYQGPWSVVFPELSERASMEAHRGRFRDDAGAAAAAARAGANLDESFEVSWLLGSQFHFGVVPGSAGSVAVVCGKENAVRERGIAMVDSCWKLEAESRAELVAVGIGGPGISATIDDLAAGLATACRLVQHGGKIVVLSRVRGDIGPAVRSLINVDEPKQRTAALRGHEADDDYVAACRLAQALAWADVFVLSGLDPALLDDLSLVALEDPEQARRLVARCGSCSFVSHAELTRAVVREEDASG
jgi:lactate racemase